MTIGRCHDLAMLPEAGPAKVKAPSDQFNGQFNLDQTAKQRGVVPLLFACFCYFPIISNSAAGAISGAQCHAQRSNSPISTFNPPSSKFKSIQSSNSTQPCPKSTNKSTGSCFALLSPAFQAKKMTKKKVWRDANGKQIQKNTNIGIPFRNKKRQFI